MEDGSVVHISNVKQNSSVEDDVLKFWNNLQYIRADVNLLAWITRRMNFLEFLLGSGSCLIWLSTMDEVETFFRGWVEEVFVHLLQLSA